MSKHIDNMTDEEVIRLRKDLSDRNWQAVGQYINEMRAELSDLKAQMNNRDRVFADQTTQIQDLKRRVDILSVANMGNGPTG